MALSSKYLDNNVMLGSHMLFKGEALDLVVAFIPTAATDDWAAAKENSLFYDETGKIGWKVGGQRVYFTNETQVNSMITAAIEAAKKRFQWDPNSGVPVSPNGAIKAGDTFVVIEDGVFDNIELVEGDILEAKTNLTGTPVGSDFVLNRAVSGTNVNSATTAFEGIVKLIESVRLDGNADHTTVTTEKAVADALIAVRTELNTNITNVQNLLQSQITANVSAISGLDSRLTTAEGTIVTILAKDVEQDGRLTAIETVNTTQAAEILAIQTDITAIEAVNIAQGNRLDAIESKDVEQDGRLDAAESKNAEQDTRLTTVENEVDSLKANDVTQDNRLTTLEEWEDKKVLIPLGDGVGEVFTATIAGVQFKDVDMVSYSMMKAKSDGSGYEKNSAIFNVNVFQDGAAQKATAKFAYAPAAGEYAIMVHGLGKTV